MTNPPTVEIGRKNEGCLWGTAVLLILILFLIGTVAVVIYLRPASLFRYGIVTMINDMEKKLEQEKTLSQEQYEELKVYLKSMKKFVLQNKMNKSIVSRIGPVNETFKSALKDGKIGRTEMTAIRSAIWKSNIPLDISRSKPEPVPSPAGSQSR